jgi:integral membrane protein (TIGR01906 family)
VLVSALLCSKVSGDRKRKIAIVFLSAVLCIALLLITPWLLVKPAFFAGNMNRLFVRHARADEHGVSVEEYPKLANAISSFLSGKAESPQVTIMRHNKCEAAFSADELRHLEDVKDLFVLAHRFFYFGMILMFMNALFAHIVFREKDRCYHNRNMVLFLHTGVFIYLIVVGAVAAYVLLNFQRAFFQMHQRLFNNDLWLLNPAEDLLIQLMPERFFVEYAYTYGGQIGMGVLLILAIVSIFCTKSEKTKVMNSDERASC